MRYQTPAFSTRPSGCTSARDLALLVVVASRTRRSSQTASATVGEVRALVRGAEPSRRVEVEALAEPSARLRSSGGSAASTFSWAAASTVPRPSSPAAPGTPASRRASASAGEAGEPGAPAVHEPMPPPRPGSA